MASALTQVERARAVRALLFTVGGHAFGIPVDRAREIVVLDEWTTVPGAAAHLVGVANLRGYVLPVLSIERLLGMVPVAPGPSLRALVVAAQPSSLVAFVIDKMLGLESLGEIVPCGPAARREYGEFALGLVDWNGRMVPMLDMQKVLTALRTGAPETA